MTFKLIEGNNYSLHVILRRVVLGREKQEIADCDISSLGNLRVSLVDWCGEERQLRQTSAEGNEITCLVPDDLTQGPYSIVVRFTAAGLNMKSVEYGMLGIVPSNRFGRIPLQIQDGKDGDMFAMRYYITTEAKDTHSNYRFWYGSSSAMSPDEMDESVMLIADHVYETERQVTIVTTSEKDIVWFVSSEPLNFQQAGLPASLNTAEKNGRYYYWSDPLMPGDDNTYTVKIG